MATWHNRKIVDINSSSSHISWLIEWSNNTGDRMGISQVCLMIVEKQQSGCLWTETDGNFGVYPFSPYTLSVFDFMSIWVICQTSLLTDVFVSIGVPGDGSSWNDPWFSHRNRMHNDEIPNLNLFCCENQGIATPKKKQKKISYVQHTSIYHCSILIYSLYYSMYFRVKSY